MKSIFTYGFILLVVARLMTSEDSFAGGRPVAVQTNVPPISVIDNKVGLTKYFPINLNPPIKQKKCPSELGNRCLASDPFCTNHNLPGAVCGYCLGNRKAVDEVCVECPAGTFIGTNAQYNTCISCNWDKEYITTEKYGNGTVGNMCAQCPPGLHASQDRKSCVNTPVTGTPPKPGVGPLGK